VFAAGDERDGLSAEEEIVRVFGIEADRLRRGRGGQDYGEQRGGALFWVRVTRLAPDSPD